MSESKLAKYVKTEQTEYLDSLRENSTELSLTCCGKEHCLPLHSYQKPREEYVLHFVLSGKGIYTVGSKSWVVKQGQMFLVVPGTDYFYVADDEDPWYYAWVGFVGQSAEDVMRECGFSVPSMPLNNLVMEAPKAEMVLSCINRILSCRYLNLSNDLYRRSALMELMGIVLEKTRTKMTEENTRIAVKREHSSGIYVNYAIEYIRSAYAEGISSSDVAAHIGISRTYLNTCFQKELGISTQRFLIGYRMHTAANLLMNTPSQINEIAAAVGYSDPLAFSKGFKKQFGMSPQRYRMENPAAANLRDQD